MSKHSADPERVSKDLLIAFRHPYFADQRPLETLQELKRNRGEYV